MKKVAYFLFFAGLAFSLPVRAQKNTGDEAALRKVIESETRSYFEGNYDKWVTSWARDNDCIVLFISPSGTTQLLGWDKIAESYKSDMKNMQPINEDDYAVSYKKYDYSYKIDGSVAVVSFKEGRGNDGTRVMEKQNGIWKIKNLTSVSSLAYAMANAYNTLKGYCGKWEIDSSSYKTSQTGWKVLKGSVTISETADGIEFNSQSLGAASGVRYINSEKEQFIKDNSRDELKYFDIYKSGTGFTYINIGSASTDTSGNITVKITNPDNVNTISYDNVYSSKSADLLHLDGHAFDKAGKITTTWSFDLKRLL